MTKKVDYSNSIQLIEIHTKPYFVQIKEQNIKLSIKIVKEEKGKMSQNYFHHIFMARLHLELQNEQSRTLCLAVTSHVSLFLAMLRICDILIITLGCAAHILILHTCNFTQQSLEKQFLWEICWEHLPYFFSHSYCPRGDR